MFHSFRIMSLFRKNKNRNKVENPYLLGLLQHSIIISSAARLFSSAPKPHWVLLRDQINVCQILNVQRHLLIKHGISLLIFSLLISFYYTNSESEQNFTIYNFYQFTFLISLFNEKVDLRSLCRGEGCGRSRRTPLPYVPDKAYGTLYLHRILSSDY